MSKTLKPRKNPCATCPMRRDVPSGVWAASEYGKLTGYDGQTWEQTQPGVFMCHQGKQEICAGWAGVIDAEESLALRLAPRLDPEVDVQAVRDYRTSVPLFASFAEAAAHGMAAIEDPEPDAMAAVAKITKTRELRGQPVSFRGPDGDKS